MIEETAQVVAIEGEFAWVETRRKTACGGCAASSGCGVSLMQKALGGRRTRMKTLNRASARVGEQVVVGIDERALVRGSLAVYAVPLLFMLAAAGLSEMFFRTEAVTILMAVAGLLAGFFWLRSHTRRIATDGRYQAVILRAAPAGDCSEISFKHIHS